VYVLKALESVFCFQLMLAPLKVAVRRFSHHGLKVKVVYVVKVLERGSKSVHFYYYCYSNQEEGMVGYCHGKPVLQYPHTLG
jgi:hypothetical protein